MKGPPLACAPPPAHCCNRRAFLHSALSTLLLAGAVAVSGLGAGCGSGPPGEPEWLAGLVIHRESAARIGRLYLAAHPEEADQRVLLARIEQAVRDSASLSANAAQAATRLRQTVREEFTRGEALSVSGWILSVTEARLYALIALQ